MSAPSIDGARLLARLRQLGEVGRDAAGRLARTAASDADKAGRDQLVAWLHGAGLDVVVDRVGNVFGLWPVEGGGAPVMLGSHVDTVVDAGIYDGSYGVLAALAVMEALRAAGFRPARPLMLAAFTNEEGVRYTPDMMGSLVYAGGLDVQAALSSVGTDGAVLGDELARIGYAGTVEPGFVRPHVYLELHIEQGPVLEHAGVAIGAVERLQGISWQKVTIEGSANHAGTTPIAMRRDAGLAAARVTTFLRDELARGDTVATVGSLQLEPGVINIIPSRATFTVDLRDPDEARLRAAEERLAGLLARLAADERVEVSVERLVRLQPVTFDARVCDMIERAATERGLTVRRMTSGAGHDAQMIARLCPAAMIFVPSRDGISHSPREHTDPEHLVAGASVMLDVVSRLASATGFLKRD